MQLVRMNIVATRDLDDRTLSHQAFLNDPQLLSRCPPPAPLRAGKYRHTHRVCPLICKSMGKPVTSTANPIGGLHRLSITHISPRLSADAILRILESDESFVIPS